MSKKKNQEVKQVHGVYTPLHPPGDCYVGLPIPINILRVLPPTLLVFLDRGVNVRLNLGFDTI